MQGSVFWKLTRSDNHIAVILPFWKLRFARTHKLRNFSFLLRCCSLLWLHFSVWAEFKIWYLTKNSQAAATREATKQSLETIRSRMRVFPSFALGKTMWFLPFFGACHVTVWVSFRKTHRRQTSPSNGAICQWFALWKFKLLENTRNRIYPTLRTNVCDLYDHCQPWSRHSREGRKLIPWRRGCSHLQAAHQPKSKTAVFMTLTRPTTTAEKIANSFLGEGDARICKLLKICVRV